MQKAYLLAIVAATVISGYIGLTALTESPTQPKKLDIPSILTADATGVDYFLNIDGIPGESLDEKHMGEINIESWSWGETQSTPRIAGGGGGGGAVKLKVQFSDFTFIHKLDKASPKLMLFCANGKHIKEALLTVRKAGEHPVEYLKVKLSDVIVTSVNPAGSSSDIIPTEQVSFNYSQIELEYKPQKADGTLGEPVDFGWDLKTNNPITTPGGT